MTMSRILRAAFFAAPLLLAAPGTLQAFAAAPPTVTGIALHVETAASKINPTNPSLSRVRAGQSFRLILYARVANVTAPIAGMVVRFRITRRGTQDFASKGTFTAAPSLLRGGSTGTIWFSNTVRPCGARIANCLPRKAGRYTVTGSLTYRGKTYSQTLTLQEAG